MREAAHQIDETAVQAALLARTPRASASEHDFMGRFVSITVDVMSGLMAHRRFKLANEKKLHKALQ